MKRYFALLFAVLIYSAGSAYAQKAEAIDFYNACNQTVQSCHRKMTLMNKRKNIQKLGKETARGTISGSVSYSAEVVGFGADVKMIYVNYSDRAGYVLNGRTSIRGKVDGSAAIKGTVRISDSFGNELGSICYDRLVIRKGNAADGGYIVTLAGRDPVFVQWDEVIQSEELIFED